MSFRARFPVNLRPMNQRKLFLASCIALVVDAMAFAIRADVIPLMKLEFGFTDTQMGQVIGPGLWGFTITVVLGGFLLDILGMRKLMIMAFFAHLIGIAGTLFASGYTSLYLATLMVGLATGIVEAVINPLIATLYFKERTKYLNILHAWWPGGLIIGGVCGYAITKFMALDLESTPLTTLNLGWRLKIALMLPPTLWYGYLVFTQKFPVTERVTSGLSYSAMLKQALRPIFLVFAFLMLFTAATELGPDQWVGNLVQNLVGIQGILLLVYSAGIMFVLRQFFAERALKIFGPIGLLIASSVLCAVGLYMLSAAQAAIWVLLAATLFGIGKTYYWPTMLGVISDRVPKGGALVLSLLGGAGMFSAGYLTAPIMGRIQDHYAVSKLSEETRELAVVKGGLVEHRSDAAVNPQTKREIEEAKKYSAVMTLQWMAIVPTFLIFAFSAVFLWLRRSPGTIFRANH